jgi:hypothetical protein
MDLQATHAAFLASLGYIPPKRRPAVPRRRQAPPEPLRPAARDSLRRTRAAKKCLWRTPCGCTFALCSLRKGHLGSREVSLADCTRCPEVEPFARAALPAPESPRVQ